MPMTEFSAALQAVLVHEGGFSNHPSDPGGATMKGVTQRVYDGWRGAHALEKRSVKFITAQEIELIYREQYWNVIRGDDLPAGLAYAVFDGAVNSGPVQAIKWLQRALGLRQIDGQCGAATLAAAKAHPEPARLIADMLALRLAFLQRLKTWPVFGKGWAARVANVQERAQAWASGATTPADPNVLYKSPAGAGKRALPQDAKPAPATTAGDISVGGGMATGTIAGTIKSAQGQLEPLAGSSAFIDKMIAVLAIATVVLVIGGLAWRAVQQWRAMKHQEAVA